MSAVKKLGKPSTKKQSLKSSKSERIVENFKSTEIVQASDDESEDESPSANSDGGKKAKNVLETRLEHHASSKPRGKSTTGIKPESLQKPTTHVLARNGDHAGSLKKQISVSSGSEPSDSQSGGDEDQSNDEDESSEEDENSDGSQSGTQSETEADSEETKNDRANRKGKSSITKKTSLEKLTKRCKPPPGFEPAKITIASSNLANLISPSSLRGKQIWHITAPSSVPISSIQRVPVEKISNGTIVLSHKGTNFGLIAEPPHINEIFLLPSQESNNYKQAGIKITRTLHLQELSHPPSTVNQPGSLTNEVSRVYTKPARQQPKGLRMRYRPFGDYSDSSENGDLEPSPEEQSQAHQFRMPSAIETTPKVKKRKRDTSETQNERNGTESPTKSHKKLRVDPKANVNSTNNSKESHTTTPKKPKQDEVSKKPPQTNNTETPKKAPTKPHKNPPSRTSTPHTKTSHLTSKHHNPTPPLPEPPTPKNTKTTTKTHLNPLPSINNQTEEPPIPTPTTTPQKKNQPSNPAPPQSHSPPPPSAQPLSPEPPTEPPPEEKKRTKTKTKEKEKTKTKEKKKKDRV